MTTLLPPEEVGKVALIGAVTTFCALFLVSPIANFVNRRLHSWKHSGTLRGNLRIYSLYLFALASVCTGVLFFTLSQRYLILDSSIVGVVVIVWCSLFFGTLQQTYVPSLNLLGHNSEFAILNLVGPTLALALSVSLVWYLNAHDAVTWLLGIAISQCILYLISSHVFLSKEREPVSVSLSLAKLRGLWRFAWPIALALACMWLQFQGYRFVLADHTGYAELGYFVAGYGVAAGMFNAFEQVVMTWFMPRFYQQVSGRSEAPIEAWSGYAACVLPLSVLCLGAVFSLADFLVSVLLGPKFQDTQIYAQMGAISEWLRVVVSVYGLATHQSMQTRSLLLPQFAGALVAFMLVSLVVPMQDYSLIPIAFSAGSLISILMLRYSLGTALSLSPFGAKWLRYALVCTILVVIIDFIAHKLNVGDLLWRWRTRDFVLAVVWLLLGGWFLRRVIGNVKGRGES